MADFLFIALRYARKLNRELQKLADAADQIRQQNLVFTPQKTGLSEFNRIMDSLDRLKTDLQHSLKEQWAMEQQKKRQFTALAHDIKTPLAIVTGNAELLSETEQSGEQREYTAFILDHARQIHRYVTGMLELTRTDALSCSADETTGSTLNESSLCPIQELLSAAAQDIENLRKKKHLSCSLQIKDLPGGLLVPKDKLQRILSNLIDNAVQYSPENGTVFLRASAAEGMLQLSIQDEGSGFSKEALTLAASEFYRADPGRSSKEHFGMGLSIASRIAGGLNGTLRLENAPGKGALVTVSLPVCRLHDSSLCPVTASK